MSHLLKELPLEERPRERLEKYGAEALSIAELLAIIIRCGTNNLSAISLSFEVLKEFENLESLSNATISELSKIKGIEKAKAISIIASLELGKRMYNELTKKIKIKNSLDAYMLVKGDFFNVSIEELVAIFLNIKGEVVKVKKITVGSVSQTIIEAKDILKWALKYSSSNFIICHNHPSGDPSPSINDIKATNEITKQASIIDINLVDHIIIGRRKYYSFKESKIIKVENDYDICYNAKCGEYE